MVTVSLMFIYTTFDTTNAIQVQDTADHDGDKSRTYDHARLEYYFMDVILYVGE